MSFFILYVKFPKYPSLPDGNELEATYAHSLSVSVYKFWISDIITLFPNCIGTISLFAVLIFLLKSKFILGSCPTVPIPEIVTLFSEVEIEAITPVDIPILEFLNNISTISPIFKLDLSIGLLRV